MIDLTSVEEAIKHIKHIDNTFVDIENPLTIYKTDYRIEAKYLGHTIYLLDTKVLDIKIDELIKENNKTDEVILDKTPLWEIQENVREV